MLVRCVAQRLSETSLLNQSNQDIQVNIKSIIKYASQVVTVKLYDFEVLQHTSYSFDLAPNDYYFFLNLFE